MNLQNKNNQMILSTCLACLIVFFLSVVFVPDYAKYFFFGACLISLPATCFYKMDYQEAMDVKNFKHESELPPYDPKALQRTFFLLICLFIVFICVRLVLPVAYGSLCTIIFIVIMMPIAFKGNQLLSIRKLHKQYEKQSR
ncbi:hypothetical protein ROU88_10925 [Macrococcus capreoli]